MKTLYLDIETAPNLALFFGKLYNQNISLAQLRESSRTICVAWKWRGGKRMEFASEFHNGREEMLGMVHEAMSAADVVATYNGKEFDIPVLNWDFARAGWGPPAPFHELDFLRTMRRRFRATSNKLEHVANELAIGAKEKHEGFELWVKCIAGDAKAWARMRRYCKQDTALLELLHDRIMPWLVDAPNLRLAFGDVCPKCGAPGTELVKEGYRYTQAGAYQRYSCSACGGWSTASRRAEGTEIRAVP